MADIIGQRGTGNIPAGLRKVDTARTVAELEPESAPLTVLTNRLSKAPCEDPTIRWWEDELEPRFDAIDEAAGYDDNDTVFTVDNGAYFAAPQLVLVTRTGEVVRVVSVSTDDVTVIRGVGSTAAAILDNDELLIIGEAHEEGSLSRDARSSNPSEVTNYTEIVKTPYSVTGTHLASNQVVQPHDWDRQAKHAGIEHAKDLEFIRLFGRPSVDVTGTHPRRTAGGVDHFISSNSVDAGGALTEAEFWTGLRTLFRYGSGTKIAFASRLAVDVLHGFPRAKIQTRQDETTYGLRVMRYLSPHGTLDVVSHPLLEGAKYGGYIFVLDMANVRKRYLKNEKSNRDTHVEERIQETDRDGRKDQLLTEDTLEMKQERTHGEFRGITS